MAGLDDQNRLWLEMSFGNCYLTAREIVILKEILVNGERAVARELGISRSTVSTHIEAIKRKFQCDTITELRKVVISSGIIHTLFQNNFTN